MPFNFPQIEEVNADKERLLLEKRLLLHRKMERAEKKRQQHLQDIVDKAHDEDNKGREIAFINGLEAQNKLHDLLQQHQVRHNYSYHGPMRSLLGVDKWLPIGLK